MSSDEKARILEAASSTNCGVRDLVKTLKWKTSKIIILLRQMNNEKLIDLQEAASSKRGRPKKNIKCTPLGLEFLETYKKLNIKPLRARKEDLERAARDASYADRLAANGHSPFKIFMELNMIVHNIKVSSETPQTTRE